MEEVREGRKREGGREGEEGRRLRSVEKHPKRNLTPITQNRPLLQLIVFQIVVNKFSIIAT